MDCVDAPVSITETQTRNLVSSIRDTEKILGQSNIIISDVQKPATVFRRFS